MNYIYLHGFASSRHSFKGSILRKRFAELGKTLLTPDLNSDDFTHMTPSSQLQVIATTCESVAGDITLLGSSMVLITFPGQNLAVQGRPNEK